MQGLQVKPTRQQQDKTQQQQHQQRSSAPGWQFHQLVLTLFKQHDHSLAMIPVMAQAAHQP